MGPLKWNCEERRELGMLISECVNAMARHSMSASQLATNRDLSRPTDFEMLRRDYDGTSVRLKVLRECLEVHERFHECADVATRCKATPTQPPEDSNGGSKTHTGTKLHARQGSE